METVRATYKVFEDIESCTLQCGDNFQYIHQLVELQLGQERRRAVLALLHLLHRVGADP